MDKDRLDFHTKLLPFLLFYLAKELTPYTTLFFLSCIWMEI